MASEAAPEPAQPSLDGSLEVNQEWRRLGRAATAVAIVTAPVAFVWFHAHNGWSIGWSLVATILEVAAFRGVIDNPPFVRRAFTSRFNTFLDAL